MKGLFPVVAVVLALAFLIVSLWNAQSLNVLKKNMKKSDHFDGKELYFDLKYKIQLITAIVSILAGVFAYFGYDTIERMDKDVDAKLSGMVDGFRVKLDSAVAEGIRIHKTIDTLRNTSSVGSNIKIMDDNKKIKDVLEDNAQTIAALQKQITSLNELATTVVKKDDENIIKALTKEVEALKLELALVKILNMNDLNPNKNAFGNDMKNKTPIKPNNDLENQWRAVDPNIPKKSQPQ